MAMDYSKYPKDWKQISKRIRIERAGNKCEWCGVENRAVGARDKNGEWWNEDSIHSLNSDYGWSLFGPPPTMIRIILTVAHIDHDTTNNDDGNLAALCQKCHLNHDRKQHQQNAAETRRQKRIKAGQQSFL